MILLFHNVNLPFSHKFAARDKCLIEMTMKLLISILSLISLKTNDHIKRLKRIFAVLFYVGVASNLETNGVDILFGRIQLCNFLSDFNYEMG